ncbi:MAG: hypothetical protein J6U30_02190 [Oscillospiraceae bacterium]|nr:hypothetical protein [Oscillospiraceae bacterium]
MLKQHSEMYGSDDWLAEEIKRESRISAWDIDGGKLLRAEHEANCDARRLEAEHALDCDAGANAEEHRREHRGRALDTEFRKAVRKAADMNNGSGVSENRKNAGWALFGGFVLMVLFPPLLLLIPVIAAGYAVYAANKKNS